MCEINSFEATKNNDNFMRFVGYSYPNTHGHGLVPGPCIGNPIGSMFDDATIANVGAEIARLLKGAGPDGRDVVVPKEQIANVMSQIYVNYRPGIGDIYTLYNIPPAEPVDYVKDVIRQTISTIVETVRTDYGMRQQNESLSVWTTVLGNFNEHGLRSHAPIKIRRRGVIKAAGVFNMNY